MEGIATCHGTCLPKENFPKPSNSNWWPRSLSTCDCIKLWFANRVSWINCISLFQTNGNGQMFVTKFKPSSIVCGFWVTFRRSFWRSMCWTVRCHTSGTDIACSLCQYQIHLLFIPVCPLQPLCESIVIYRTPVVHRPVSSEEYGGSFTVYMKFQTYLCQIYSHGPISLLYLC